MYTNSTTRAFARPRHLFDLSAAAVWTLAAVGTAALSIARTLDDAAVRREARASAGSFVQRPRARLGPHQRTHARYGVTDARHVR